MANNLQGSVDVIINAKQHSVWNALIKPEIVKKYFFGTNLVTEWQVGGPIKFKGEYEGKSYEDKGTVLAFEPEKLIEYSYWSSMSGLEDKPENYVTLTYKVIPDGEKTKVEITQKNIRDEKTKDHSLENWKMVLNKMKTLLEENQELSSH